MPNRLLFICAMNVCRSPLMAATFVEASESLDDDTWTIISRGITVTGQEPVCSVAASLLSTDAGREYAESHVSTAVTTRTLRSQDIILTATRAERARVAQLSPDLRSRTFTLREAVVLGRSPFTIAEIDFAASTLAPNARDRLGGYPLLLNIRRGLVPMPAPRRSLPFLRPTQDDPIDIPDVHVEGAHRHKSVLEAERDDVRTLWAQIAALLALQRGGSGTR